MAEWSVRELIVFGRMVGFLEEALTFLQNVNMDGNQFSRLKNPSQLAVRKVFALSAGHCACPSSAVAQTIPSPLPLPTIPSAIAGCLPPMPLP